jgi:microcompartment protein CcmL/EutN
MPTAPGPALALVELTSVARGIVVVDAMVKKAKVSVVDARSVSPGRYLVEVWGGVGEVEEAHAIALSTGGATVLDALFLPAPHDRVWPLLRGERHEAGEKSIGLVECYGSAAAVKALDAAAKTADVDVLRLHLADGLGGKGWFLFTGDLHLVQVALEAAAEAATDGFLQTTELIAAPHPDAGRAF